MSQAKNILIVDDEENLRQSLKFILQPLGYNVSDAPDAEAALEALRTNHFQLILLDLIMPGMHGLELLPQIRALHPDIAVLIFAADTTTDTINKALQLGAQGFIPKPIEPSDIIKQIQSILGK